MITRREAQKRNSTTAALRRGLKVKGPSPQLCCCPALLGEPLLCSSRAPFNTGILGLECVTSRNCLNCAQVTFFTLSLTLGLCHIRFVPPSHHSSTLPCVSFSVICLPMRLQGLCMREPSLALSVSLRVSLLRLIQEQHKAVKERGGGHGCDSRRLPGRGKGLSGIPR